MSALLDALHALQRANELRDKAAVLALMAPDVEYLAHVDSKPIVGHAGIARFLNRYWAMASQHVWRVDRYAENGDTLLVEGTQEYVDTTTGRRIVHPYMGIFEFCDGKIARWRDYFEKDPPAGARSETRA